MEQGTTVSTAGPGLRPRIRTTPFNTRAATPSRSAVRHAVASKSATTLFLATGVSWWFSGMGEFPWRFLALRNERLSQLRFGYFDEDNKCDVLTESGGAWMIASGGTGQWYRLGQVYAPFSQVAFGRFDLSQRDHRTGATRRTTHAFWRTPSGQWKITTLTGANQGWKDVGSSSFP